MPKKKNKSVRKILSSLRDDIDEISQYDLLDDRQYIGVLKGSFVKAFEFTEYCYSARAKKSSGTTFFILSTLRGICEDLITLKFVRLLRANQRNDVIQIVMLKEFEKTVEEQSDFFKIARPFQPVLRPNQNQSSSEKRNIRLTEIGKRSGLWNTQGKLPPIEQMANRVKLRQLYSYIYRGTSALVHFSPRITLRHGWGGEDGSSGQFSTEHFSDYYLDFCQTYSAFLFILISKTFRRQLGLTEQFLNEIQSIEDALDDKLRWPELITFEEMNIESPSPVLRIAMKMMSERVRGKN